MTWYLYLLGFLSVAVGGYLILYTDETRSYFKKFISESEKKLRLLGIIPFILGILFFISAFWGSALAFLIILSLLMIAKGIFIFLNPNGMAKALSDWWQNKASDRTYRFAGLIMVILGIVVVSAAQ